MRLILPTPEVLATPGQPTPVDVVVWNDSDVHEQIRVRALGVEDAWSAPPQLTPVLAPNERHVIQFVITLPEGFPPGAHSCAFEAATGSRLALDPDAPPSQAIRTELTVRVEDLSKVSIQLEPRRVRDNGRFRVRIQNRSLVPVRLHLSGRSAGDALRFRFRESEVGVRPGGQAVVKSRVVGRRHLLGDPRKTSFTVIAQGQSEPVQLSGTWERSAALRSNVLKAMAILTVLAIWAGAAGIGISQIRENGKQAPVALGDAALRDQLDGGAEGESGPDGSGAEGGGNGVDPSSPGSGRVVTSVGGLVEGKGGDGVSVQLRPVSAAAPEPPDSEEPGGGGGLAAVSGSGSLGSGGIGMQLGRLATVFVRIDQMQSATTTADGVWSFGGVEGPGFYELRFGKQGFSTKSTIVEVDEDGAPVRLDISLDAAFGRVVGSVVDPKGVPIAGAAIQVSDGLIAATTTADGAGAFSVDGLTQDTQYTVSAAAEGYGTGFAQVRLDDEQSAPVELTLVPGVGTIFGTVLSSRDDVLAANNGSLELADATITVTDGADVTRTISSLDDGFFQLSGLPLGGPYTVRIEADQHLTQVQTVTLTGDELELNVTLTGANGRVQGDIVSAEDGSALNGAGVTISSDTATFKTLSDANGAFDLVDVPPGDYTATFGLFGFTEQVVNVTVRPGAVTTVDTVSMEVDDRVAFPADGSMEVTAFLVDEPDTKLAGLSVFVNDELRGVTDDTGFLRIEGLTAGTAFLRISDLRAQPTVAEFTRPVNIAEGGTVDVQAGMRRLASLKGTVSGPTVASVGGGTLTIVPLPDIAVCIVPKGQGATYLDARAGSCRDHAGLVDDTSTLIDGSFEFDVVPSGAYDVVFQSARDVPTPTAGMTKVSYLYEPTIEEYTFNAGASLENEDIVLDLYPILSVQVSRPEEGAGAFGSDDLDNFVGVDPADADLRFYDSTGAPVVTLLDPVNTAPDTFVVAEVPPLGGNGRVAVQILTSDPDVTGYAISKEAGLGRPISTPMGLLRGTGLQVPAATNSVLNVAIPLVTGKQFAGSFKYDYERFPVVGEFTSDDAGAPADSVPLDPGVIDVTVAGRFDVFGASTLAPGSAAPVVAPARSVTRDTDASGNFVYNFLTGVDVPAGATVELTAAATSTLFQQLTISDIPIPQQAALDNTKLEPAGGHVVKGVVRNLCHLCNTGTLVGTYNERSAGAGVEVQLVSAGTSGPARETTTDANGAFSFADVPLGQHRIIVIDAGRRWYHAESTAGQKQDANTTARILVDVTSTGVVYRPDDKAAANLQVPAAVSTTSTDPAGNPVAGGGAYIGFIDMAAVTADVTNVSGTPTRVELWRSPLLDIATVNPCPSTGDYAALGFTSEGVEDVTTDTAVSFAGLERLDQTIVFDLFTGLTIEREFFCVRATRAVDGGKAVAVPELLRDGRPGVVDPNRPFDPLRPLTASVAVALAPAVQFRGSVESLRGTYQPVSTSADQVQIVDVLAGASIEVYDTASSTACGSTSRGGQAVSEPDGSFLTSAILGRNDHCLHFTAAGHVAEDLPRSTAGEAPPGGIDDVGTVTLDALHPNLTVDLVNTSGDPVELGTGTVTLRFTPGGTYDDADTAFSPTSTDTTSVTFSSLVPTIYELVISVPGYTPVTKTVNVLPTDSTAVTLATTSVLVDGDPDDVAPLEGIDQAVSGSVKVQYGTAPSTKLVAIPAGVDFTVSVSRKGTDLSDLVTENQGADTFVADLKPGKDYTFTASAPGFETVAVTGVTIVATQPNVVDLLLRPRTRNVTVPLDGITGATDEMIGTVVSLEATTDAATPLPGTPYTATATVARSGSNTARATLTNVVPGTYRLKIDAPTRLPGYRDTLTGTDAAAYPPTAGSFTVDVGWIADGSTLTVDTVTLAVYKRIDLISGEGNGRPITVAEACDPDADCTLIPQPSSPDTAAVFFTFTVTSSDPTQGSYTFDATGHEQATITVTADGTTAATETVCLTLSAVTTVDPGPDGTVGTGDDVTTVTPADDCAGISGVLTS